MLRIEKLNELQVELTKAQAERIDRQSQYELARVAGRILGEKSSTTAP